MKCILNREKLTKATYSLKRNDQKVLLFLCFVIFSTHKQIYDFALLCCTPPFAPLTSVLTSWELVMILHPYHRHLVRASAREGQ